MDAEAAGSIWIHKPPRGVGRRMRSDVDTDVDELICNPRRVKAGESESSTSTQRRDSLTQHGEEWPYTRQRRVTQCGADDIDRVYVTRYQ